MGLEVEIEEFLLRDWYALFAPTGSAEALKHGREDFTFEKSYCIVIVK